MRRAAPHILSHGIAIGLLAISGCTDRHQNGGTDAIIAVDRATADSVLVAVEENGASVAILELPTGATLHRISVDSLPHEVEILADGRTAVVSNFGLRDYDRRVGDPGTSIAILDLVDGNDLGHIWLTGDSLTAHQNRDAPRGPHGLKLRPPEKRELFVNTEVGGDSMLVFDMATRRRVRAFPIPDGTHNFIFSADGRAIWLMAAEAGIFQLNPDDGDVIHQLRTPTPIRGLTWMPDQSHLLASGRDELLIVGTDSVRIERRLTDLGVGQILYSAVTSDGQLALAPAPWDTVVVAVNIETGKVEQRIRTGVAPIRVILDENGERAYVATAEDSTISVINLIDWSVAQFGSVLGPNGLALVASRRRSE